jgi:hypothetical protein
MATRITNAAELYSLAAVLHDARFTADGIAFDATTRHFSLKCWLLEPCTQRWRLHQLSFAQVSDCNVNVKEDVRYYEVATLLLVERDHKLKVVAHYGIEISLAVDKLDGGLTETNESRSKWEE